MMKNFVFTWPIRVFMVALILLSTYIFLVISQYKAMPTRHER